MQLDYTKNFLKNYTKRISQHKNLDKQFQEKLQLFLDDKSNPILKDHKLIGAKKDYVRFLLAAISALSTIK